MEIPSSKKWALDTNILVYLLDKNSSFHHHAKKVISMAKKEGKIIVLTQQNIVELIQTLTKWYKLPLKTATAQAEKMILRTAPLLHPLEKTTITYLKLCQRRISAESHFDLYLAATLLDNDIDTFITNNPKDFQSIKNLNSIPLSHFNSETS